MKYALVIVCFLSFIFVGPLKTYYSNKGGYNNKIPYQSFFNGNSPKPAKIKVQTPKGKQAIVPVNTKEEKVEQKGL